MSRERLGIPRTTFYRWYDRYLTRGESALADRSPKPSRVWNRLPDDVRELLVQLELDEPVLSPRELAVRFTDTESYFVSEASVYRLLKAHDLITSPAFIVIKAACDQVSIIHKPRLLSDNGASYVSGELADWLDDIGMSHVRGAPYQPQTQGKTASQRCKQRLPANGDVGTRP